MHMYICICKTSVSQMSSIPPLMGVMHWFAPEHTFSILCERQHVGDCHKTTDHNSLHQLQVAGKEVASPPDEKTTPAAKQKSAVAADAQLSPGAPTHASTAQVGSQEVLGANVSAMLHLQARDTTAMDALRRCQAPSSELSQNRDLSLGPDLCATGR